MPEQTSESSLTQRRKGENIANVQQTDTKEDHHGSLSDTPTDKIPIKPTQSRVGQASAVEPPSDEGESVTILILKFVLIFILFIIGEQYLLKRNHDTPTDEELMQHVINTAECPAGVPCRINMG